MTMHRLGALRDAGAGWLLGLGIAATLAANVAHGLGQARYRYQGVPPGLVAGHE
jgi:hypothetical protein